MKPETGNHSFQSVKELEASSKQRMDKVLADLLHEMTSLRTGRASVNILEPVKVDYYGTTTPINQLGTLHVPEPQMITVQPWDTTQIAAIEKAIRSAELGLNPSNDGKIIRVPIPALNEERRKELVKKLHHVTEEHRVAMRNIRRDANDHLKKMLKDKAISEDEERRAIDDVQKLTDTMIGKIDTASKAKEKEILEIK